MANNTIQIKRTTVTGRTPNTTNSSNTQYINTGELALNLTDKKMFTSDGTSYYEVGSKLASITVAGLANVGNLNIGTISTTSVGTSLSNSTITVGNSTVNSVINSTSFTTTSTISVGNSTVNTVVNSTSVSTDVYSIGVINQVGTTTPGTSGTFTVLANYIAVNYNTFTITVGDTVVVQPTGLWSIINV